MRKLLAGATVLVFGAGAMSSASAQLQLKGSDTLEDVAKNVLADCIASIANPAILAATDIVYAGGGSGGGESAMIAGQQRIAPMSRPFKNGAVGTVNPCPVTAGTQGTLDARGEQLLIGLDGIAIVAANQTPPRQLVRRRRRHDVRLRRQPRERDARGVADHAGRHDGRRGWLPR